MEVQGHVIHATGRFRTRFRLSCLGGKLPNGKHLSAINEFHLPDARLQGSNSFQPQEPGPCGADTVELVVVTQVLSCQSSADMNCLWPEKAGISAMMPVTTC